MNRFIRHYLPKGEDLSVFSQADLDVIAARLNARARTVSGFHTPAEMLDEVLLGDVA
jgi:IS30 family transposase